MDILTYLAQERTLNVPVVAEFLNRIESRYGSLTPEFSLMLTELTAHLLRGGKWHRPALALLAYRMAGGVEEAMVRPALAALELLHRHLLIHDDIIDQDYERHDGPTIERVYRDSFQAQYPNRKDEMFSKGMAIVAGDVVSSFAYELLTEAPLDASTTLAGIRAFNQLKTETTAGWQLQTEQNFMPLEKVSYDDVVLGMTLVSAQYSVVWPIRMGQVVAGRLKPENWDTHLDSYGLNAGLSFQIADDILGMFGNERETGKPVGHDYREGKKTLLVVTAYDRAKADDKAFMAQTLGTTITEPELQRVRQIMESTGALADTKTLAKTYAQKACQALTALPPGHQDEVNLLAELADFFANRTH